MSENIYNVILNTKIYKIQWFSRGLKKSKSLLTTQKNFITIRSVGFLTTLEEL